MLLDSRLHRPWLLTLLCLMLLASRVGGAHLHLCFDGLEPRTTIHMMDNGLHQGAPGRDAEHQDVDIAVADDVIAKFTKLGWDIPLLLAVLLICGVLLIVRQPSPRSSSLHVPSNARSLRPPLRGPPRLNSL